MNWNRVDLAKSHRLFYAQVPVVVTVKLKGRVGAMLAIWCTPLSLSPALVGIALAPEYETYKMIVEKLSFTINWLEYSYARQIPMLGEISGKEHEEKLASVVLTMTSESGTEQPSIQEASTCLDCRVLQEHQTGTHRLIIAEAVSAFCFKLLRRLLGFLKS